MHLKKVLISFIVLNLISIGVIAVSALEGNPVDNIQIKAGYGQRDITPQIDGLPLNGYGNSMQRLSKKDCYYELYNSVSKTYECKYDKYSNPLKATAVVFYDGSKYAIFVTVDFINLREYMINEIIPEIYNNYSELNEQNAEITISATHTHSAPDLDYLASSSNESEYPKLRSYKAYLIQQISYAVGDAIEDLKLAKIYTKKINIEQSGTLVKKLNFVRLYYGIGEYPNGKPLIKGDNHGLFSYNSNNNTWVYSTRYDTSKGFNGHVSDSDSEMQLIKVDLETGKDILMINWQAHPAITGGSQSKVISADFVGFLRQKLEIELPEYNVAYYTGAAGNLNATTKNNPTVVQEGIIDEVYSVNKPYSPYATEAKVSATKAVGDKLAEFVINNIESGFSEIDTGNIKFNKKTMKIRYKDKLSTESKLYKNALKVNELYKADKDSFQNFINNAEYVPFEMMEQFISSIQTTAIEFDEQEEKYVLTDNYTLNTKYTFLSFMGVQLDDLNTSEDESIFSGYHAARIIARNKNENDSVEAEINAISIGGLSFVTAPYEMFDTNGKAIKNSSKSNMTFVLELTNGGIAYAPSIDAYDYGSYEVDNTLIARGQAEVVQNELITMVNDNSIKKIQILQEPSKMKYEQNTDKMDLAGGKLKIIYYNNESNVLDLSDSDVILSGFDSSITGIKKITVNYKGMTTSFNVEILNKISIVNVPFTGIVSYYYLALLIPIITAIALLLWKRKQKNKFTK